MTKLGMIRHGSTAWNKEGRAQGNSDIPLDEQGLADARKLADRLSEENWDIVYSSDLMRAKQTAEIIDEKLDVSVILEPRLREVSGGQIEGTTEAERVAKWGVSWWELELGIEKKDSVITRGMSLINEITTLHKGRNILIVSHGSFITHILKHVLPDMIMENALANTSLTVTTKIETVWESELYNCTNHLI